MADLPALFQRNADRFSALVDSVGDRWSLPTPCTEWDVKALVNHVTYEQLWAPHLVRGETIADVGDRYEGDQVGDDPPAVWHRSVAESTAAFGADGALAGVVHLSMGDTDVAEYLMQMLSDLCIHGWDLATAISGDTHLDDETVDVVYPAMVAMRDQLRASGAYGTEVVVADDADLQTKLLAICGRKA